MKKYLFVVAFLFLFVPLSATTYYVDSNAANDLGDGPIGSPFKTLAHACLHATTAGDDVYLNRGSTFRELLTIPTSGNGSNQCVWGAYGSGDLPIIFGSEPLTSWAYDTGHWRCSYNTTTYRVWFKNVSDGKIKGGHSQSSKAACTVEYDFFDSGTYVYVYTTGVDEPAGDPDSRYTYVEACARATAISASAKDYVTVENIEVGFCQTYSVLFNATSDYYIFQDMYIHNSGYPADSNANGIRVSGSNGVIQDNIIHDHGRHGIFVTTDGNTPLTTVLVQRNTIFNCYHSGIDIMNQGNAAFEYVTATRNFIYTNSDYEDFAIGCVGFNIQGSSAGYLVDYVKINCNIIYNMTGVGINCNYRLRYAEVYNNTVYRSNPSYTYPGGEATGGIVHGSGEMVGNKIKNNIIFGPWANPLSADLSATSTGLVEMDYNCWWTTPTTGRVFYIDGTTYHEDDWALFRAAYPGFEANGMHVDPLLANAGGTLDVDYKITASSPCKDTGVNVSLTEDYFGNSIPYGSAPDIGMFEYQGVGVGGIRITPGLTIRLSPGTKLRIVK